MLPVTGTPAAPRLGDAAQASRPAGAAADAIDWVVHMRRFADGALLAERAARGQLQATEIDALAREIAAFQAGAAVAAPASGYGEPAELARLAQDNFAPIGAVLGGGELAATLQRLQRRTQAESARLAPHMAARRAAGRVREGHGDLHLGNLLWLDGRARLFDAIEFDPRLRWIDTVCDLAFVFMDLHAHGLAPLAWRLLNAWLAHSGDFDALPRLAFDAVYRALVRAKVAALRCGQGAGGAGPAQGMGDAHAEGDAPAAGAAGDAQAAARADVARYVRLAARLAAPRAPWLALTMGVSGSGKSSQTQALIEQRGLVRLRADVERKRLFGLAPDASSAGVPGGIYGEDVSERLFERLRAQAQAALAAGYPVLVDATFIRQARRAPFIALAEALGVPWRLLAFDAPPAVLRERVRQRQAAGGDASEADLAVLQSQLAQREPLAPDEARHALCIDTTLPVDWARWAAELPPELPPDPSPPQLSKT